MLDGDENNKDALCELEIPRILGAGKPSTIVSFPSSTISTIKYLGEGHDYERVPDFGMVKVRKEEREMREMRSGSRCLRVTIVTSERQPPGSTA